MLQATYYDGKSSNQQKVNLQLEKDSLVFRVNSGFMISNEVRWEVDKIERQDFNESDKMLLSYGEFPKQSIQIEGIENIKQIKETYPIIFRQNFVYSHLFGKNKWKIILGTLCLIIGIMVFYYVAVVPVVSEKIVDLFPKEAEIKLGDRMSITLQEQLDVMGAEVDKEKSKQLMQFYKQAGFKSKYPIKLYYIKQDVVNAFAIPGGSIYVYKGIMDKMNQWEDLSGLLAHELSHVDERHSLKGLSKNLTNYFIISFITSDLSGVTAVLLDNAATLQNLANSRSYEKEADLKGLDKLREININPQGMVNLFNQMKEEEDHLSDNQKKYLTYIVTHPLTSKRVEYIQEEIKKQKLDKKAYPNRNDLEKIFSELK